MADTFKLSGEFSSSTTAGDPSGELELSSIVEEAVSLANKAVGRYDLTSDAEQSVNLGGLSGVNVLVVKATGGKVKVKLTSADGSAQAVPVDGFAILISRSVPFTAMSLTRVAGTETIVNLFMGQAT